MWRALTISAGTSLAGGSSPHWQERQQEEQLEGRQLLRVVGRWHPGGTIIVKNTVTVLRRMCDLDVYITEN